MIGHGELRGSQLALGDCSHRLWCHCTECGRAMHSLWRCAMSVCRVCWRDYAILLRSSHSVLSIVCVCTLYVHILCLYNLHMYV